MKSDCQEEVYLPTHRLKKDFYVSSDEIYKKGSFVYISTNPMNIPFVDTKGNILVSNFGAYALFSENFFLPRDKWFEPISEITNIEYIGSFDGTPEKEK